MTSASWEVLARTTWATNGGTATTHLLFILIAASPGTTKARISTLLDAPFKLPQEGQGVSSTGVEKVDGWMQKHDAEFPDPQSAKICCSGWIMLGPRTDT